MIRPALLCLFLSLLLVGCSPHSLTVGEVNVDDLTQRWPRFQEYEKRLANESTSVAALPANSDEQRRRQAALQAEYDHLQFEVTQDLRAASQRVADREHLSLVVTRTLVGFGGYDITDAVLAELDQQEPGTATSLPSQ